MGQAQTTQEKDQVEANRENITTTEQRAGPEVAIKRPQQQQQLKQTKKKQPQTAAQQSQPCGSLPRKPSWRVIER
jgi:hypothetical protein